MKNPAPSLVGDYKYCQSVIKKYSKSFYYAFSALPEEDARAVYAVYAFCRMADDAIDEADSKEEATDNLLELRVQLDGFCNGEVPETPMWRALNDVRSRYDLDLSMLYAQIEGQASDVHFEQPETFEELIDYSRKVAGSVGRLLLPILSEDTSAERQLHAENLGVAMQITNILRDVGEDVDLHDRVYIPKFVLSQFGYSNEQLRNGELNVDFIDLWEHLAREAEVLYDDFQDEIIHYKEEARIPLLLSMSVYREILTEVRKNGYDCFKRRNFVSMKRKMEIKEQVKRDLKSLER
ncbi:phytoene/squalene synthase family protein [Lacicoccus alkaliphilus]|uniref:Phytoene synthase n=1 Tax=Lacicoccus alkaliphilus DSM 16010 TaxID=1123231 RepID=A0A1M7DTL1_9BACL|nr:phytoene/squalene synthase family protein [Salinicoccus alkaliphilus]SHL82796.1 phytoene synthase [Salinicoccus alkaliphilus DSM 16010]